MQVAYGFKGSSHADDPVRAVASALDISVFLKERSQPCAIGMSIGDLVCMCVGARERHEYSLFGPDMNLAARLMRKAELLMQAGLEADGRPLLFVSSNVFAATSSIIPWERLPVEALRHVGSKMAIWRPGVGTDKGLHAAIFSPLRNLLPSRSEGRDGHGGQWRDAQSASASSGGLGAAQNFGAAQRGASSGPGAARGGGAAGDEAKDAAAAKGAARPFSLGECDARAILALDGLDENATFAVKAAAVSLFPTGLAGVRRQVMEKKILISVAVDVLLDAEDGAPVEEAAKSWVRLQMNHSLDSLLRMGILVQAPLAELRGGAGLGGGAHQQQRETFVNETNAGVALASSSSFLQPSVSSSTSFTSTGAAFSSGAGGSASTSALAFVDESFRAEVYANMAGLSTRRVHHAVARRLSAEGEENQGDEQVFFFFFFKY